MFTQLKNKKNQSGFSLMELVVAMAVTLGLMTVAVTLLARTLNIRSRENERVDELADVQRAMNIMSREISNSGFNLINNGIVAADSNNQSIRFRANLNKFNFDPSVSNDSRRLVQDSGEDVTYFVNVAGNTNYLARWDRYESAGPGVDRRKTVLANRVDAVRFYYFNQKVTYTQDAANCQITSPLNAAGVAQAEVAPDQANFVVLLVCIGTPAVGTPGSEGYQRPFQTILVSDVALRNSRLNRY